MSRPFWKLCVFVAALAGSSDRLLAQTFEPLYRFSGTADGRSPLGLVQGPGSSLYGTTQYGGSSGNGTAFLIDYAGHLNTIHTFNGSDGSGPQTLVQSVDGFLYGVTTNGGATNHGSFFKMDSNGSVTTLYSFLQYVGLFFPAPLVQYSNGLFYGTTEYGGPPSCSGCAGSGGIFSADTNGNLSIFRFLTADEGYTSYGLIQGRQGYLFGTGDGGYGPTYGTVLRMDPTNGAILVLHTFTGPDGSGPRAPLVQDRSEGYFYGTTIFGGSGGELKGTVFKIDGNTGAFTSLHSFTGPDGDVPQAALIQASDSYFYGTTSSGGGYGYGTVFRMDSMGNLVTLYSFSSAEGSPSDAALTQASDGNLYGTTASGGPSFAGTIYRIRLQAPVVALSFTVPSTIVAGSPFSVMNGSTISASVTPCGNGGYQYALCNASTGPCSAGAYADLSFSGARASIPTPASAGTFWLRIRYTYSTTGTGGCNPGTTVYWTPNAVVSDPTAFPLVVTAAIPEIKVFVDGTNPCLGGFDCATGPPPAAYTFHPRVGQTITAQSHINGSLDTKFSGSWTFGANSNPSASSTNPSAAFRYTAAGNSTITLSGYGSPITIIASVSSACANRCDLNADGMINFLDIQVLTNAILTGSCPSSALCGCDINKDGAVNFNDLQLLASVVLGGRTCPTN